MGQLAWASNAIVTYTSQLDRATLWAAVAGLLILVFTANYFQTSKPARQGKDGQPVAPREHPSLLPFIGHAPQFVATQEWFLHRLRGLYPEGIFSIRLFGSTHSFISNPGLTGALLSKPRAVANNDFLVPALLRSNFGMTKADTDMYFDSMGPINENVCSLLTEQGLGDLMQATLAQVRRTVADFVTFNSSPADQTDWEVAAGAEVVEDSKGESFVQADLMELVRNYIAKTANQGLFGTNFVENFPDAWQHIWKFDAAFVLMSILPSWLPVPKVGFARAAARQFRQYTYEFHEALDKHMGGEDPGVKWQDLDDVCTMMKERAAIFRRIGLPIAGRAGADLSMAWAMNANANSLVPWMIWEISRDAVLVEQIREEIAPYVRVAQPDNEFGSAVWLAPELEHIDVEGLLTKCPLLKGAYIETLRLYTGSWAMKRTVQDMIIGERGKDHTYLLKEGTYVHCPQDLHQMDPEYYPDPKEFIPQRHIRETEDKGGKLVRTAEMGNMKPYSEF